MKRWFSLLVAMFAIMAVAGAKLVYYPPIWDDPIEQQATNGTAVLP
jgi:hypothetical protein